MTTLSPDALCFAFSSCQYPAGLLDKSLAYQSYERLAARLAVSDAKAKPSLLLLLGDQIYSDATAGLLDPVREDERYEKSYKDFFAAVAVNAVLTQIPVKMMLDDHELDDNWEPISPKANGIYGRDGLAAYWRFQRNLSNPPYPIAPLNTSAGNETWQTFIFQTYPFFMLDSRSRRSYRSVSNLTSPDTLLLDRAEVKNPPVMFLHTQTLAIQTWLSAYALNVPKFVSCASIVLPRHAVDRSDTLYLDGWDGYPTSLHRLLGYICKNEIQNVIFLSGDEHLSCFTDIELWPKVDSQQVVKAISIHASALYAPMPFANSKPANLRAEEMFEFQYEGATYVCHYKNAVILKGDGYGVVSLAKKATNGWCLEYDFDGKKGCTTAGAFNRILS